MSKICLWNQANHFISVGFFVFYAKWREFCEWISETGLKVSLHNSNCIPPVLPPRCGQWAGQCQRLGSLGAMAKWGIGQHWSSAACLNQEESRFSILGKAALQKKFTEISSSLRRWRTKSGSQRRVSKMVRLESQGRRKRQSLERPMRPLGREEEAAFRRNL